MLRGWTMALGLSIALCGCSKGGGDGGAAAPKMDSPKATAESLVKAMKDKDPKAAVALLPTADLVHKYFECPNDELAQGVARRREKTEKEFAQGMKEGDIALGEFDKQGTEEKLYRVGEEFEGCKVKAVVTIHKSKLELRITKDGKTDFDGETWRFVKFGDENKWYFAR